MKKGLSLVEVLTATALVSVLLIVIATLYLGHFKIFSNQSIAMDVNSQTQLGLDEIANGIRESTAVVATCTACSGNQTGANILILQLWPLNASGDPADPISSNYDYIIYKLSPSDNSKLIKIVLPNASSTRPASNQIIANSITGLQFTYDNADPTLATEVTTQISASKTALGKTYTTTFQKEAVLRNK